MTLRYHDAAQPPHRDRPNEMLFVNGCLNLFKVRATREFTVELSADSLEMVSLAVLAS